MGAQDDRAGLQHSPSADGQARRSQAIVDEKTVAMVQVARLEWEKFEAKSPEAVAEEYFKYYDPKYTLLHLDHVPVIDEDHKRVDYLPILERAAKAGYQSCMVDGSRLPLDENIAVTEAGRGLRARATAWPARPSSAPSWATRAPASISTTRRCSAPRRASPIWARPNGSPPRRTATG
jgi:hypothetical protein